MEIFFLVLEACKFNVFYGLLPRIAQANPVAA
jgi:hypothetical protein